MKTRLGWPKTRCGGGPTMVMPLISWRLIIPPCWKNRCTDHNGLRSKEKDLAWIRCRLQLKSLLPYLTQSHKIVWRGRDSVRDVREAKLRLSLSGFRGSEKYVSSPWQCLQKTGSFRGIACSYCFLFRAWHGYGLAWVRALLKTLFTLISNEKNDQISFARLLTNVWRLLSDILSKSWDKWSEGLLPQNPQETLHTTAWFACSCVTWVPTSLNLRTWKLSLSEAFGECSQIYSVTTWSRSVAWLVLRIVECPVYKIELPIQSTMEQRKDHVPVTVKNFRILAKPLERRGDDGLAVTIK